MDKAKSFLGLLLVSLDLEVLKRIHHMRLR
ncbi:UNVERIFIED_CONTAM: hypothetical protein GTU68_004263 [Idotea baltica]|nr:hypothetical protein [Idotea baltica]